MSKIRSALAATILVADSSAFAFRGRASTAFLLFSTCSPSSTSKIPANHPPAYAKQLLHQPRIVTEALFFQFPIHRTMETVSNFKGDRGRMAQMPMGFQRRRKAETCPWALVQTMVFNSRGVEPDRSVPLDKYWRGRSLAFSLVLRCQGLCGSAKNTWIERLCANRSCSAVF